MGDGGGDLRGHARRKVYFWQKRMHVSDRLEGNVLPLFLQSRCHTNEHNRRGGANVEAAQRSAVHLSALKQHRQPRGIRSRGVQATGHCEVHRVRESLRKWNGWALFPPTWLEALRRRPAQARPCPASSRCHSARGVPLGRGRERPGQAGAKQQQQVPPCPALAPRPPAPAGSGKEDDCVSRTGAQQCHSGAVTPEPGRLERQA